jgi:hypothetical protein
MLEPVGFFSYATSDDESSRGRLSLLRQRLADELQQHVGRGQRVRIYQDAASIGPGAAWERHIRENLLASSFLIPIVTPGFFQSEWCCREVLEFRGREIALGRDDLIFPIHYIDTDHLDPDLSGDCWSAEVYALLRTRQIANFRQLRFKDYDSEAVLTVLDRVAVGIRDALRGAKRPAAAPTPPESSDGAGGASGLMQRWRRQVAAEDAGAIEGQNFHSFQVDGRAIPLELIERAPGAYMCVIRDRTLFRDATFIFEVSARRTLSEIKAAVPGRVNVGPNTKMNEILHAHLPGVPLVHLPTLPPQVRAVADHVYFYLDRTSPLWPEFGVASAVGIHFAGDWPELQLGFWAVRESH